MSALLVRSWSLRASLAGALALVLPSGLVACGRPPNVTMDERGTPRLEGRADDRFATARAAVKRLTTDGHALLRLHLADGERATEEEVELLGMRTAESVARVVVVRVADQAAFVAGRAAWTDEQLAAASAAAAPAARDVAVLRVDDDASMRDVVRVMRAARAAGFGHVVLSALEPTPFAPTAVEEQAKVFSSCAWPRNAPRATALARVNLEVRSDGRGGIGDVRIVGDAGDGFGYAAAMCVSSRRFPAWSEGEKDTVRVEMRAPLAQTQCGPTPPPVGYDAVSRGAYTPSESTSGAGPFPSTMRNSSACPTLP